jgi:hypothetical protein
MKRTILFVIIAMLFTGCIFNSNDSPQDKPDISGVWYSVTSDVELRFTGKTFQFWWGDTNTPVSGNEGTWSFDGINYRLEYSDHNTYFQVQDDELQFLDADERGKYVRVRPQYEWEK